MIQVLVADDHPLVREGVKRLITHHGDMRVIGEAADGDEALAAVGELSPDVLLLDISMPGTGFLELLDQLRKAHPKTQVLILSYHDEEPYVLNALRRGAAGYVTKDRSPRELVDAIRRVSSGQHYLTPPLTETLIGELDGSRGPKREQQLSSRESQVLSRLAKGQSLKEIGADLDISAKTVSSYRSRLLEKLGRQTTADLIRYAIEHGYDN